MVHKYLMFYLHYSNENNFLFHYINENLEMKVC